MVKVVHGLDGGLSALGLRLVGQRPPTFERSHPHGSCVGSAEPHDVPLRCQRALLTPPFWEQVCAHALICGLRARALVEVGPRSAQRWSRSFCFCRDLAKPGPTCVDKAPSLVVHGGILTRLGPNRVEAARMGRLWAERFLGVWPEVRKRWPRMGQGGETSDSDHAVGGRRSSYPPPPPPCACAGLREVRHRDLRGDGSAAETTVTSRGPQHGPTSRARSGPPR